MSFTSVHHLASPHKVEAVGMTHNERLDLDPGGRVYAPGVGRNGLFIGELAARGRTTRKALRLYETARILPAPRRTASGYRVYDAEALRLLGFVRQAQRLGFTLGEIREIVGIKRGAEPLQIGRAPSELQSLAYLVCRLLLEKKKKK